VINLDLEEPKSEYKSLYIKGDIRIKKDVERAIKGNNITTIISLAAMHHDFGISELEYFETNEKGTEVICDVASEENINTIVFYSSVAVYGANVTPSYEGMLPNPNMPYGASKLAGEKILEKWASEKSSRRVLIIRPALVFGTNNTANMYKLIHQIDLGIYFHIGKANNVKSIAYVKNIVDATLFLLTKLAEGVSIYNYADEPHLTSKEIANTISKKLDKKIKITLPKQLGIILGLPFDLIIKVTGKNLPISSARVKKLATETYHLAEKVIDDGFNAKYSTQQGLEEMVEWYEKSNQK
jgi:nucleoside-diphosphate-sugar epimerase